MPMYNGMESAMTYGAPAVPDPELEADPVLEAL